VERLQQSIDNDLLDGPEDEGYEAHFNMNSLQKGAFKDRFEGYSKSLGSGGSPAWMTPNEIRAMEDLNPIDGGDELPKPTNVAPPAQNDNQSQENTPALEEGIAA
jgi:phage portal protein BeeE